MSITSRTAALGALSVSLGMGFGACSSLSTTAPQGFEQSMLNATYYGAYHRPVTTDAPRRDTTPPPQRHEEVLVAAAEPTPTAAPQRQEPPRAAPAPAQDRPDLPASSPDGTYDPALAAAYVRAVYELNETPVGANDGTIVDIYRYTQEHGTVYHTTRPAVGDLVFFHNTYDRSGDGRNNDWYTHIGIVEDVDSAGTVSVLSFISGAVSRTHLNLDAPSTERESGRTLNSTMRQATRQDPPNTQVLAGELFAGFGSLLGNRSEVYVIDQWRP